MCGPRARARGSRSTAMIFAEGTREAIEAAASGRAKYIAEASPATAYRLHQQARVVLPARNVLGCEPGVAGPAVVKRTVKGGEVVGFLGRGDQDIRMFPNAAARAVVPARIAPMMMKSGGRLTSRVPMRVGRARVAT